MIGNWPPKSHDSAIEQAIADELRLSRLRQRLKLKDAAAKIGISSACLKRWENAEMFPDRHAKLIAWAKVVGRTMTVRLEP